MPVGGTVGEKMSLPKEMNEIKSMIYGRKDSFLINEK